MNYCSTAADRKWMMDDIVTDVNESWDEKVYSTKRNATVRNFYQKNDTRIFICRFTKEATIISEQSIFQILSPHRN